MEEKEMSRPEEARRRFEKGLICAQAVLSVYGEQFGLGKALSLKIASGFGAGMGRMSKTCGAVTGAVMVIGLRHGQVSLADAESREDTYRSVKEFIDRFTALHGSVECKELIGYDLSNSRELKLARDSGVFQSRCCGFVYDATRIVEDVLRLS
jgi:C_GCAxxG_C_C family probable redox protein